MQIPNRTLLVVSGLFHGFGIKNVLNTSYNFKYNIDKLDSTCKISNEKAMSFIKIGKNEKIKLNPKDQKIWIIRFEIPNDAENCAIRYGVNVTFDKGLYTMNIFDIFINKEN